MGDAGMRRSRMTLLDQLTVMEPKNLRDLLSVRDEVDAVGVGAGAVAGAGSGRAGIVTLGSILEMDMQTGRTLLEIIREEDEARRNAPVAASGARTSPEAVEAPAFRVSLITLLSLADRMEREDMVAAPTSGRGIERSALAKGEEGEEEAEVAVAVADERIVCCVCMVRKKGAAFIPCGHTFCRACSRELWTSRGSCPLCNILIFDILDIF